MNIFTPFFVKEKKFDWGTTLELSGYADEIIDFINANKFPLISNGKNYFSFEVKKSKEGKYYTSHFKKDKNSPTKQSQNFADEKLMEAPKIAKEVFDAIVEPENLHF